VLFFVLLLSLLQLFTRVLEKRKILSTFELGFTGTKEKWSYVSRILFPARNSQLVTQKLSARAAMMERDSVLIDLLL